MGHGFCAGIQSGLVTDDCLVGPAPAAKQVVNVHIPQNLRLLRSLIRERQSVLENLGRCLAERGVRGEEQYHYTGRCTCDCWKSMLS